jgi:hypothetical protein
LIEIQERQRMAIHYDVAAAVDALLRGHALTPEIRYVDEDGKINVERVPEPAPSYRRREMRGGGLPSGLAGRSGTSAPPPEYGRTRIPVSASESVYAVRESAVREGAVREGNGAHKLPTREWQIEAESEVQTGFADPMIETEVERAAQTLRTMRIYPYGVGQNRLRDAAASLGVPIQLVENLSAADVVITLKNYYRQQPQPLTEAERRSIPVYILRSNTSLQMEQVLADIFHLSATARDVFAEAIRETQDGIQRVLNGADGYELAPQAAAIRGQQHQLIRAANLISHSYGREPYRRVRIFRK